MFIRKNDLAVAACRRHVSVRHQGERSFSTRCALRRAEENVRQLQRHRVWDVHFGQARSRYGIRARTPILVSSELIAENWINSWGATYSGRELAPSSRCWPNWSKLDQIHLVLVCHCFFGFSEWPGLPRTIRKAANGHQARVSCNKPRRPIKSARRRRRPAKQ